MKDLEICVKQTSELSVVETYCKETSSSKWVPNSVLAFNLLMLNVLELDYFEGTITYPNGKKLYIKTQASLPNQKEE